MNKFFRYGLTAIALTFILGAFAAVETKAQPTTEILKRMDEHYKALKSLQANVSREKTDSQLGEVDRMSGTISLLPGAGRNFSMRLDWTQPRAEIISVVNGQYVLYTPNLKQAFTGSSDSKQLNGQGGGSALKVISMTKKEELKANYNIEYLGQEDISGGIKTWHLKLTPKTKTDFEFSDIWVDGNGMPLQVKITRSNETDLIRLTDLKKNVSISGAVFKVSLPKDTKVIKG